MDFPCIEEVAIDVLVDDVVEDTKETAVKFGFLGGGQAGGKLAQQFYSLGYRRILAVNTTEQDMAGLTFPGKLIIGDNIHGAGKNPAVGRAAAEAAREKILRECRVAFGTDVEHILVMLSSGGGTGCGSCPVLVDIARDYLKSLGKEPKVGVIVATPKASEGPTVNANSKSLLQYLQREVDAKAISPLVLVDNERVTKSFPRVSIAKFYEVANQSIARLFNIFNELAAKSSPYGTLDRADYRTILAAGTLVLGMTALDDADTETALADAAEKNVKNGMLADLPIRGATHAGAIIVASQAQLENIPQAAFDMAFQTLGRAIGSPSLLLHSGIYEGPDSLGSRAYLYTVAAGLNAKIG